MTQSTTVEIYMVNSTGQACKIKVESTTVEIYMVNSTRCNLREFPISTTVEIYMVNSTKRISPPRLKIYNSRNLYGQFDRS